MKKCMSWCE